MSSDFRILIITAAAATACFVWFLSSREEPRTALDDLKTWQLHEEMIREHIRLSPECYPECTEKCMRERDDGRFDDSGSYGMP